MVDERLVFSGAIEGHFRITLADAAGVPEFYAGILERGVRQLGAPGVRVELESQEPPGGGIRVRW